LLLYWAQSKYVKNVTWLDSVVQRLFLPMSTVMALRFNLILVSVVFLNILGVTATNVDATCF